MKNLSLRHQQLALFCCLVFLLLFRGALALKVTGNTDDVCYLEWLYRLLFLSFPLECYADFYLPGPALVWLPAGIMGLVVGTLLPGSIHDWIPVLVGYQSFLCWVAAVFLVDRVLAYWKRPGFQSPRWTIWFLLSVPILRFAVQRNGMSHGPEILILSLVLYLLVVREAFFLSLGLCLWLVLIRINDSPLLFLVLAHLWDRYRADPTNPKYHRPLKILAPIAGLAAIPLLYVAFVSGYGGADFLHRLVLEIDGHEIARVLFAQWDSLLYTQPWWLLVFGLGVAHLRQLNWFGRGCVAWMGLQLLVCMGWTATGGFLYRYLIGTCFGALVIWIQLLPQLKTPWVRAGKMALVGGALYSLLMLWLYTTRYWPFGPIAKVGFLEGSFSSVLLVGITPLPLTIFSVLPESVVALLPWAPHYRLTGPALWTLLPISLGVLAIALVLIRERVRRS